MNKVVQLTVIKQQREASQEALWQRFVDLSNRSKETGKLEDGIAAGKAYAEFCQSFLSKAG